MKKYYEAYDDRYVKYHQEKNKEWAGKKPTTILEKILKSNNINQSSTILEIGCGEGQNADYLQKSNYNVMASDVSPEAINWCRKKYPKLANNYFVLDILDNNYSEKFDCIYSISTLHMLVLDEDRKKFFQFIYEHLNDNGIAIITSMGDGEREQNNSDISKSFELTEREIDGEIVNVATTSCRIVNWDTLLKEAKLFNFEIIRNYISEEISGFNNSMILELKKIK